MSACVGVSKSHCVFIEPTAIKIPLFTEKYSVFNIFNISIDLESTVITFFVMFLMIIIVKFFF